MRARRRRRSAASRRGRHSAGSRACSSGSRFPGLHRDARFDLLVTLGRLGCYELSASALQLGGDNEVTVAAKRAFGIGDSLLLERRAGELAAACEVPLEALDVGLYNWGGGVRATLASNSIASPTNL